MELSEFLNIALGGGLLATIIGLLTLKSTVRKAGSEAEMAKAEAEAVRIDNAEPRHPHIDGEHRKTFER